MKTTYRLPLPYATRLPVVLPVLFLLLVFMAPHPGHAKTINLATGAEGGMYHTFGVKLESILEDAHPNLDVNVISTDGTVENINLLETEDADVAFSQNDLAKRYHQEKNLLNRDRYNYTYDRDLRAITGLYPESMHILLRENTSVEGLFDLRKANLKISIGAPGSGTRRTTINFLESVNIDPTSEQFVSLSLDESRDRLKAGTLDGVIFVSGTPNNLTSELLKSDVKLFSLENIITKGLSDESVYFPVTIQPSDYQQLEGPVQTFGMQALLVADKEFSSLWTERMLVEIEEHTAEFQQINSKFAISREPSRMLRRASLPVHPGTEEFLGLVNYNIAWDTGLWLIGLLLTMVLVWWCRKSDFSVRTYRKWTSDWHETQSHRSRFSMNRTDRTLYNLLHYFRLLYPYIMILLFLLFSLIAILLMINYMELRHYWSTGDASQFINTTLTDLLVWIWILLSAGTIVEQPLSPYSQVLIGVIPVIGISGFFMIVGKLYDTLTQARKHKLRGTKPMGFKDHVVIYGFNKRVPPLVRHLQCDTMIAGQDLVLVTDFEESNKDLFLDNAGIENKDNVEVIRRSEDLESDARKVNFTEARTLVCMADERQEDPDGNTILNVMRFENWLKKQSEEDNADYEVYTIAELKKSHDKDVIEQANIDEVINEDDFVDKLVAQTARKPGTSELLHELITPDRTEGKDEIYMAQVEEYPTLEDHTFDELLTKLRQKDILLIGFRLSGNEYRNSDEMQEKLEEHGLESDKKIFSNPSTEAERNYSLQENDEIFLIAPDWSVVKTELKEL